MNTQELEYKDKALRFVVAYGSVFFKEDDTNGRYGITDYYAGRVSASNKIAKKNLHKALKAGVGVDLEKSTDPSEHTDYVFNGTFAEAGQFAFMRATLVLKDGSEYIVAYSDPYMTLTKIIKGLETVGEWADII